MLGRGGMGIVYSGTHALTGDLAAIKTLWGHGKAALSGIRREIHALKRVSHPGVVRIVADGVSEGMPWYAMELLSGRTLRDALGRTRTNATQLESSERPIGATVTASSPLPDDSASLSTLRRVASREMARSDLLATVRRACGGLAHLHACGIVHRDLKPENIFIRADGTPVLVDFGIAAGFAGAPGREVLDAVDGILGTVAYMAPEQIRGEFVDARTDLYAIGCILYECLTGEPPFGGIAAEGVLHAHLHRRPLAPSELADDISPDLDRLVLRLLEKEPRDRLGYADDVARSLGEFATDTAEPSPRGEPPYIYRPPFVGREDTARELSNAIRKLSHEGSGGQLYIAGESGAGKTRLAMELAQSATRLELTVVLSQCGSFGLGQEVGTHSPPLHAFAPFLMAVADHCGELGAAESARLLGRSGKVLAPYQRAISDIPDFAALPEPAPMAPAEARTRVLSALVETLLAFAAVRPCLLIVDDLQWADELSLGLLRSLSKTQLVGHALLVVGTYRIDEATEELRDVVGASGARVAVLRRFEQAEVGAMVQGMLAMPDPPRSLVAFLHRRCEGNPFFVVEYLRAAIAGGILARDSAGNWKLSDGDAAFSSIDASALSLPLSLATLIERRLQDLGSDSRALLRSASVLGREFGSELLLSCVDLSAASAMDALLELRQRQVLEETASGQLRFVHDRLLTTAYDTIGSGEAPSLHRRAALAIENNSPEQARSPSSYAALGHHWARAAAHGSASRYFKMAADHAKNSYAHKDAILLYRAHLQEASLAEAGEVDGASASNLSNLSSASVYEIIGELCALTGQRSEARVAFHEALSRASSPLVRTRLWRKVGKTHETQHEHGDALKAYNEAEAALGAPPVADDHLDRETEDAWWAEWIGLQIDRVMVHYWLAQDGDIERLVDQIRTVATTRGTPRQRAQLFKGLAYMNFRRERYALSAQTVDYARERLSASISWGDEAEILEARFMLALTLLCHSQPEEAEIEFAGALPTADKRGDVTIRSRFIAYLTVALRRRGDVARTHDAALQCLELATACGLKEYIGVARANLGWVAWQRGELDKARLESQAATEIWEGLSLVYSMEWMARLVLLALDSAGSDQTDTLRHASRMLDIKQQLLPPDLTAALSRVVSHGDDVPSGELTLVIDAARQCGFL